MMKRRDFSAICSLSAVGAASVLAAGLPNLAMAQGGPVEGKQFQRLSQPLPVAPGKIEVVEFFWYGCPHCYAFEPVVQAWSKQLPADVSFRRVHVGFRANIKLHQRLFFALEAMGKEEELLPRVFSAFHVERLSLDDEKSILDLAARMGLDMAKFTAAFNSFGVQTKSAQASKLSEAYRIDGVPALGIGGKFLTSPAMAGIQGQTEAQHGQQAVAVADYLIKLLRSNKG
ncbi:thiol:disulfide interchange protein DsbA/DsbL [Roseateles albus]|uniref:Thiol:disulfide interchange protein n=1 Tax=Roseateles albus TaxID=2987525 RepID=A0ABT5K8J3_9BURK|nr:thiol:disulfide interchange protein DsbA/DsbL [Roseateles albus]MDC8770261.1 thiol:disulfide interchange protein DsbA/DsbL [Roseateles albus]